MYGAVSGGTARNSGSEDTAALSAYKPVVPGKIRGKLSAYNCEEVKVQTRSLLRCEYSGTAVYKEDCVYNLGVRLLQAEV